MKRLKSALAVGLSVAVWLMPASSFLSSAALAADSTVDYKAAGDEATKVLADYLRIDTTVPPGNEKLGAEFLAAILRKNGIDAQILETVKPVLEGPEKNEGRACVYARLKGTGKKKAIVLLNHIDVVPAEAKDWKHAPFGGEIHDGELWGRGALDMKGMGVIELMAMLLLKRSGVKLDRDIIYLGTPDEEVGGVYGAAWFKKNHPELVSDAEFLLNEGFCIEADEKGVPKYWGVDFGEKSVLWLELKTRGEAGHASMPLPGSATVRLVKALDKIVTASPNFKVLPQVEEYFKKIAKLQTGELKSAYENIVAAVADPAKSSMLMKDLLKSSMLRNTVSLTVMKAGYKTNVIPAEATAHLDCRLLPGVTKEEFVSYIQEVVDDSNVEVSALEWEKAEPSSIDTAMYKAIEAVAAEETPDAPVVPVVVPWFTDSHWFRELGITAYGFEPVEIDGVHMATMHGKDERIPLAGIENGVRRMHKILLKAAAAE